MNRHLFFIPAILFSLVVGQAEAETVSHQVQALVEPPQQATLSAEMPGKILSIPFEDGEPFSKGDMLVEFDCSLSRAERKVVESQLAASRARLEFQQNLQILNSGGRLDLKLAEANHGEMRAKLSLIDLKLKKCKIAAPFSGHVLKRLAEPFESVTLYDPLLHIAKTDVCDVRMIVPVRWRNWLTDSKPFSFRSDDLKNNATGKILRFGADVDPASQTFQVIGRLDTEANIFLPGMAGTVSFTETEAP